MSAWEKASKALIVNLQDSLKRSTVDEVMRFCSFLMETKSRGGTVYLIGAGRSLEVLMMFRARVVRSPLKFDLRPLPLFPKPQIEDGDSALVCTGTGETASVLSMTENWLAINRYVGLISSFAAQAFPSKIFSLVTRPNALVLLSGIAPRDIQRRRDNPEETLTPLLELYYDKTVFVPSPTIFELTALVFLESIIKQLLTTCQ
jgi:hypothetical protein